MILDSLFWECVL